MNTDPQKDRRSGKGVRVCADESRPAAGADLTGSLTIRHTERKAASTIAHAVLAAPRRLREWFWYHSIYSHVVAPIWVRIPEKQRWTSVHWLDKSRRFCWADLVSDALAYREKDPCDTYVPRLRGDRAPRCASVCDWSHPDHTGEHPCSCYCSKFQFTATGGAIDRRPAS